MNFLLLIAMLLTFTGIYLFLFQKDKIQEMTDEFASKMKGKKKKEYEKRKEEAKKSDIPTADLEMIKSAEKLFELNILLFKVSKNVEIIKLTKNITETMIDILDLLNSKNHTSAIFNATVNKYFPVTLNNYFSVIKSTDVTSTDISDIENKLIAKLEELNTQIIKVPNELENSLFEDLDKAFLIMEEMLKDVK